jgi:type II secretory pathway pseudopilin PulG
MTRPGDRGYIMVVLLIGMGITAIWMTAALPAWRHQVQRQREEDLIFIGEQYARAIVLYQRKNRGAFPPSIEILVTQRHLRKAWKDPITGEDFAPIGANMPGPGQPTGGTPGRNTGPGLPQTPGRGGTPQQQGQLVGITGVRSRSQETSIKVYKNLQQHSLWPFDAAQMYSVMGGNPLQQQGQQPGGGPGRGGPTGPGGPGRGGPGGPGGPGTGRGGDGRGGPTGPTGPTLPGRGRGGGL